jgi:hypothetical protein
MSSVSKVKLESKSTSSFSNNVHADQIREIDETLGDFREYQTNTNYRLKDHDLTLDSLLAFENQHHRDIEAIAFSPSKKTPIARDPEPESSEEVPAPPEANF